MQNKESLVAFYSTHEEAERAIIELQESGFDMKSLSILGTAYHSEEHVTGYYNVGDRMKKWGSFGAFWGGFWGLLFGSAVFFIPGLGSLLVAGPLVSGIIGALEGATVLGGAGVIGAALVSLGIPKHKIVKYETEIKAGKFMLLAHGTQTELEAARKTLRLHIPKENLLSNSASTIANGDESLLISK